MTAELSERPFVVLVATGNQWSDSLDRFLSENRETFERYGVSRLEVSQAPPPTRGRSLLTVSSDPLDRSGRLEEVLSRWVAAVGCENLLVVSAGLAPGVLLAALENAFGISHGTLVATDADGERVTAADTAGTQVPVQEAAGMAVDLLTAIGMAGDAGVLEARKTELAAARSRLAARRRRLKQLRGAARASGSLNIEDTSSRHLLRIALRRGLRRASRTMPGATEARR